MDTKTRGRPFRFVRHFEEHVKGQNIKTCTCDKNAAIFFKWKKGIGRTRTLEFRE